VITLGLFIVAGAAVVRCLFEVLRWAWRMTKRPLTRR